MAKASFVRSPTKASDMSAIVRIIAQGNRACVNARVKHQPAPAGLDAGAVVKRHHALNWLIDYGGQDGMMFKRICE